MKDEKQTTKDSQEGNNIGNNGQSNGKTGSQGKQHNNKGKGFRGKNDKYNNNSRGKGKNSPEWYIPDEKIAKAAANIPFTMYAGMSYEMTNPTQNEFGTVEHQFVPGIAIFKYLPSYGTSSHVESPINVAANALYAYIRHVNSGAKVYESSDLIMYIMAAEQLYLMLAEARRILLLAQEYTIDSRLIPERLVTALGFDIKDIQANLADYRKEYNILVQKINAFAIPNEFNLISRRAILGSIVLQDDADVPKQLIIPDSDGYYVFDPISFKTGGAMVFVSKRDMRNATYGRNTVQNYVPTANKTCGLQVQTLIRYNEFLDFIRSAMRQFTLNTDINTISGDILKAFGDEGCFKVNMIDETDKFEFTHDVDLLEQFKNASVLDIPGASLDVATRLNATSTALINNEITMGSRLKFVIPQPTNYAPTQNEKFFFSTTPVVCQINNHVVFWPIDTTVQFTDSTSYNKKYIAQATRVSGWASQNRRTLILDTYRKEMDYKSNLEYSRLMMMEKVDETIATQIGQITSACFDISVTFSNSIFSTYSAEVTKLSGGVSTALGTVVAGSEIGLGWLIQAPDTLKVMIYNYARKGEMSVKEFDNIRNKAEVLVQWFQNSTARTNSIIPTQGNQYAAGMDNNQLSVIIPIIKANNTTIDIANITVIDNIVKGLDFSPRDTVMDTPTISDAGALSKDPVIFHVSGKFGNLTGRVQLSVLESLHETAMIGLISKKAYDRVRSAKKNSR